MKKTLLILSFILAGITSYAQQPIDSLYIWVHFQDKAIVLDIPSSYFHLRTQVPTLPDYVRIRNMHMSVPDLPAKKALLQTLSEKLVQVDKVKTTTAQLDYLRTVVLYIYFSNNDVSNMPVQVKEVLNKWQTNSTSEEFNLAVEVVRQYVDDVKTSPLLH